MCVYKSLSFSNLVGFSFKNQNKLETIIFDLSRNDKYDGDEDWSADQISFLVKFIYELRLNHKDTQIFIYHPEIKKLLNEKDSSDNFKIHLIYLYNSIKINNLKDNYFGSDNNKIYIIDRDKLIYESPVENKNIIAQHIIKNTTS